MKAIFTILLLACSFAATAQTTMYNPPAELIDSPECAERYETLKKMHAEYLASATVKKETMIVREFNRKLNLKANGEKLEVVLADVMGWIKDNVEKTHFESYEAAEKEFAAITDAFVAVRAENKDYFAFINEAKTYCGDGVLSRVVSDVSINYPELNNKN